MPVLERQLSRLLKECHAFSVFGMQEVSCAENRCSELNRDGGIEQTDGCRMVAGMTFDMIVKI